MFKTQQTDDLLHEDLRRNFVVYLLYKEVSLNLGHNAEIDTVDLYEVLFDATNEGTSISTLCNTSGDSPGANSVLYHLRPKFEPERLERVVNALAARNDLAFVALPSPSLELNPVVECWRPL